MAYGGGVPNHTDSGENITDVPFSTSAGSSMSAQVTGANLAQELVQQLGQFSLDSSPVLPAKVPKFTRKFSLRELEIQQTIGWLLGTVFVLAT